MWVFLAQWAKETELRELRVEVWRLKSAGKTPAVQSEETSEEVKTEEDCKMEVSSTTLPKLLSTTPQRLFLDRHICFDLSITHQ